MTGMWNFKFNLCCLSIATFAGAAEISFTGDNKITGELVAMDQDGTVTLRTPHANEPIRIISDGIAKIDFGKLTEKYEVPAQNLTLINGDSFPVEILSLDDKVLKIKSPSLGELDVPREIMRSLEIGSFSKKTIYTGPKEISEWRNTVDEVSEWTIQDQILLTNGSGEIYRDMKLPENYSVRFKVSWIKHPNFRFTFGDPMEYKDKKVNRYYLQFGRAGMEIKRESTGKQPYYPIATIERLPQEFASKEVWIEVRVNRKAGSIDLYINDRLEDRYMDKNPNTPSGTGIAFKAYADNDNQLSVSDIVVSQWDDRGNKQRTEDRGDLKDDSVIGSKGDRSGGRLQSITDGKSGKVYRFKSNFQENPTDLQESEVASVYFASAPNAKLEPFKGMNLFFQERGNIQVSKCVFNDNIISITHPLLGDLQLNLTAVSRLERSASAKPNAPEIK
jgi:hypothetical protein